MSSVSEEIRNIINLLEGIVNPDGTLNAYVAGSSDVEAQKKEERQKEHERKLKLIQKAKNTLAGINDGTSGHMTDERLNLYFVNTELLNRLV